MITGELKSKVDRIWDTMWSGGIKQSGGVAVTDDRAARSYCEERGVRYTGTFGILKACCQSSMITPDDADHLLATMIRYGFYSPVRRISDVL